MTARLRRLGRGAGALVALAVLVVGVPVALWASIGWPLPHVVPNWSDVRSALTTTGVGDDVIVKGLALVCWVAWSVLAASVAAEVVGFVRGRGSRRIPFAGPVQALAANLVAAAVLTLAPPAARAPSSAQPLAVVLSVPREATLLASPSAESCGPPPAPVAVPPRVSEPSAQAQYTVVRRDTLWGIAEAHLGDPFRWPELFELNQGRPQPDGRSLTDPNLIRPGWVLTLPVVVATPTVPPKQGVDGTPGSSAPSGAAPSPTPPSTAATPASTTPRPTPNGNRPVDPATKPADVRPTPSTGARKSHDPGGGIHLPAGSFVGLSLAAGLSASMAAARLHRRRRRVPEPPGDGISFEEPLGTEAVRQLRRADLTGRTLRTSNGRGTLPTAIPAEARQSAAVAVVSIGSREDEPVELDLLNDGGIGLTGAGAPGVARSIVLDFATNAGAGTAEVVIAGSRLAGHLFPGVEPFAGVEVIDDVEAAITRLEVELVHRTRLIDDDEETDFASYVGRNPAEPLPVVLLVTDDVRGGLRLRLDTVASVGRRLGIGALVLNPPPSMAAITIAEGGTVEEVSGTPTLRDLRGAQLFSLEPVEAIELLSVVAAGRGAPEQIEGIAEQRPESFDLEDVPASGPIAVHVLGMYRIEANGEEIRTGFRTKARELLAFLLLHPQGKSVEAAVDAIWPDSDLARGAEGFRTAVGNLRKVVRAATHNPKARVIERVGERYRVEPSMFTCDLWRFESALREAKLASGSDAAAPLHRAAAECRGDLLDGAYYEWAEAPREDIRRRALDALARLADLKQASGDDHGALGVLEEAVALDPYSEGTYRRLMAVQLELANTDSARRTYKQLESRLSELDLDPDDATAQLLSSPQGSPRIPRSAPARASK